MNKQTPTGTTKYATTLTPTMRVVLLLLLLLPGMVLGADERQLQQERLLPGERALHRMPYTYPVLPGTAEWERLDSHAAMVEATLVPAERLENMTTNALVTTVLTYPLFGDAFLYNHTQQGFDAMASQSNAVAALLERPDAGQHLLRRYQQMRVPTGAVPLDDAAELTGEFAIVETLLAQAPIQASLTTEERETLLSAAVRVAHEKGAQPDIFSSFGLERSALVAGRLLYQDATPSDPAIDGFLRNGGMLPDHALAALLDRAAARAQRRVQVQAVAQDYETDKLVKTPRGTKVKVWVINVELTAAEKKDIEKDIKNRYPQAIAETGATRRYNCHSYAWHSQSGTNTYWMSTRNDDTYWVDKSYVGITSAPSENGIPKDIPNNAKVGYPESSDHSAIKISSTEFRSKWGPGPRMRHKPGYAPYMCKTKKCTTSLIYYKLK